MEFDGRSVSFEISADRLLVLDVWQLMIGVALVAASFLILIVARLLTARRAAAPQTFDRSLAIDVASLATGGPAEARPTLEFYGTPVRVAAIVLAPVGREGVVPEAAELPQVLEQLVSRLGVVVARDRPLVRLWPEQLSSQGFHNAFFNNLALPGQRGKGTPWCSVAGKFTADGRQYLVGLLCCAAQDNGLGQFVIEHEGRWNDVLRVK